MPLYITQINCLSEFGGSQTLGTCRGWREGRCLVLVDSLMSLRNSSQGSSYRGLHVSDRCHYLPSLGTSQPVWKKHRLLSGGFFSSLGLLLLLLSSLHAGKLGCFMLCKA